MKSMLANQSESERRAILQGMMESGDALLSCQAKQWIGESTAT